MEKQQQKVHGSVQHIPVGWASATRFSIPIPKNEKERLAVLQSYQILDTPPEREFDDITALASSICDTPVAMMTLMDSDRLWFKSKIGVSACEVERDITFCAHAIMEKELFVVKDATMDPRFAANPMVTTEPKIRFYAGAPLIASNEHVLGTLCVVDRVPRDLTQEQTEALQILSRQVISLMNYRRRVAVLERQLAVLQKRV